MAENSNIREPVPHWITINEAASEKLNELLRILCVVTNFRFFVYSADQAWFTPLGKEEKIAAPLSIAWGQEFYTYPEFEIGITEFSTPDCLPLNTEDPPSYYNRFGGVGNRNTVDLPESIDDTIFKYCQLSNEARESFISSATLFSNGIDIWPKMKSLSFAAFISSIETLVAYEFRNTDVEKCSQCGQDQYRVMHKFRTFLQNHGSPDPSFRKYADQLYKTRSKILHEGSLFLGDLHITPWGSDGLTEMKEDMFRRGVVQTTRICLVNWLMKANL